MLSIVFPPSRLWDTEQAVTVALRPFDLNLDLAAGLALWNAALGNTRPLSASAFRARATERIVAVLEGKMVGLALTHAGAMRPGIHAIVVSPPQ